MVVSVFEDRYETKLRKKTMKTKGHLGQICLLGVLMLALPAVVRSQDFVYTITNGAITITGYIGSGGAVVIPATIDGLPVTGIGDEAFDGYADLTSVTIPNSVTSIGTNAFYDCYNLTSVTIGNSVTNIGDEAFSDCTSLTAITVDPNNPAYSSMNGVLFDKGQTTLIAYPGGLAGNYTIPDSVTSIGDSAFYYCTKLTSVTIPDSVTSIGDSAFYYCTKLTSVTIGNSVTSIGDYAFYYCRLTSVTIPDSVTSIGDSAFYYCYGLTSVTIPNSVTSIGDSAFGECWNLTSVTIPDSVTSIGDAAFVYCSRLTSVTIPNSVTSIGSYAFSGCPILNVVYFQGNAPGPGNDSSVFSGDNNATAYYLPGTTGWGPTFDGIPTVEELNLQPPVAGPAYYTRQANVSLKIAISDLLTNVTVTKGDYITLVGVGTDGLNLLSTNGTTLFTNSTFIFYTNSVTPNVNDSFNYTVSDSQGWTSIGKVLIIINNNIVGQTSPILLITSTNVTATFFGVPGYQYTVERSTNLVHGLGWVTISTNTAPVNGVFQVIDNFQDLGIPIPPVPSSAYYRLVYNP